MQLDNKRINYYNFIHSHTYKECDETLKRIKEKVNLNEIIDLIDSIEFISSNHKLFLKTIIKRRFETFFNI